jgi:hypothetical protein
MTEQFGPSEGQRTQWLAELALVLVEVAERDTAAARDRAQRLAEAALEFFREVPTRGANPGAGNMAPMMALAAVGDPERALSLLELFKRDRRLHWALRLPEFDALRTHERFQRLVEESRPR